MSQRVDSQMRPRLRQGVILAPADAGRWQARFDFDGVALLEGEACRAVLPWLATRLDGARTVDELQRAADCPCGAAQLEGVLSMLAGRGYVLDARADVSTRGALTSPTLATIEALGADAEEVC